MEGGTSGASPIVASLEADAKQGANHALGFANPLLYDLRLSAGILDVIPVRGSAALALEPNCYADPALPGPACVFTLGRDSSLTEAPGYDDVTGIGSPTSHFIAALDRTGVLGTVGAAAHSLATAWATSAPRRAVLGARRSRS